MVGCAKGAQRRRWADAVSAGSPDLSRIACAAELGTLIRVLLLVVEALIAVRILLKVTGANEHAGFATFLYKVSSPFIAPFHPVFADDLVNGHPFEVGSLLAMGVYAVLAYFVVRLAGSSSLPTAELGAYGWMYALGSVGVPPMRSSKCTCGPVELPLDPSSPIGSPPWTACPGLTNSFSRWPYSVIMLPPWAITM